MHTNAPETQRARRTHTNVEQRTHGRLCSQAHAAPHEAPRAASMRPLHRETPRSCPPSEAQAAASDVRQLVLVSHGAAALASCPQQDHFPHARARPQQLAAQQQQQERQAQPRAPNSSRDGKNRDATASARTVKRKKTHRDPRQRPSYRRRKEVLSQTKHGGSVRRFRTKYKT